MLIAHRHPARPFSERHDGGVTAVGVIGLGAMGSRVAQQFIDAGHNVVVWNRTVEKIPPLTELGATAAANPAEMAGRVDVLITMVADPNALRDVSEGPGGFATHATPALTVIEMSTVGPAAIVRLANVLPQGVGLLDAPVLGSTSEADAGQLSIFVGGTATLVDQWSPLLSVLGRVLHVGELGAGAAAKLVANSTLFAVLAALGEALLLARRLGLAPDEVFDVLAGTPLGAQAQRRREAIEKNDFPHRFSLRLARKDIDLIVDAAAAAGVELRVGSAAREWFTEAERAGLGDLDYSAVLAHILGTGTTGRVS